MLALVVTYEVADGDAEKMVGALVRMGARVKTDEPDCISWQASRSRQNPNVFHLYEVYPDQAAFDAHRETPHFKEHILGVARPLTIRREGDTSDVLV